jgi:hypothetical protein
MHLVLRRATVSRISGDWSNDDYDVFDGERDVGRIYRINASVELSYYVWEAELGNRHFNAG